MISIIPEISTIYMYIPAISNITVLPYQCHGISVIYGIPAIFSVLFATVLMISDFIIPCITNKKVIS